MATADDALALARLKLELSIPADVYSDDVLLTGHRDAAVDFIRHLTGFSLANAAAADVPPLFTQAAVCTARIFYDGIATLRATSTLYALVRPLMAHPFIAAEGFQTTIIDYMEEAA